jgi:hypothetical protein
LKKQFDVREAVRDFAPCLLEIWSHIAGFESKPDYALRGHGLFEDRSLAFCLLPLAFGS